MWQAVARSQIEIYKNREERIIAEEPRQETMIPAQWKPTFRTRKPPLIGITTIQKKASQCQTQSHLRGVSRLNIGEISYILDNCQSVSKPPNSMDTKTGIL